MCVCWFLFPHCFSRQSCRKVIQVPISGVDISITPHIRVRLVFATSAKGAHWRWAFCGFSFRENFLGHTFRGSGCRTTWGVSLGKNFLDVPRMEKYEVYSLRRCFKWMHDAFAVDILRRTFCGGNLLGGGEGGGGGGGNDALAEHCQRVPLWRCAHTGRAYDDLRPDCAWRCSRLPGCESAAAWKVCRS